MRLLLQTFVYGLNKNGTSAVVVIAMRSSINSKRSLNYCSQSLLNYVSRGYQDLLAEQSLSIVVLLKLVFLLQVPRYVLT